MILSSLTAVSHVLHVRHELSGGPVPSLRETLVPPTPWWYSSKLTPAGDVAVVTADRFPDGAPDPAVRLSVADPAIAASLAQPLVEVSLTQAEQTHVFASVDLTVTVVLVDKKGKPKPGATVQAVDASGVAVALTAVAGEDGTYRSVPSAWTKEQLTFDIQAGGVVVGHYRLNPFALDTRLHGVVA
jgi:hypothetical protein